jgi:hypothetical protein
MLLASFSLRSASEPSHRPIVKMPRVTDGSQQTKLTRFSSIPSALVGMFSRRSVHRKRTDWNERVDEAVRELRNRIPRLTIDALTNEAIFNQVASEADRIAQRSREEEKLQALLNAIQNCVLPGAPGNAVQIFFLRFIDELQPVHLHLLGLLNHPRSWLQKHSTAESQFNLCTMDFFLARCLPAIGATPDSRGRLVRGLQSRGLIQQYKADVPMTLEYLFIPRTTAMGRQFLAYINKPPR